MTALVGTTTRSVLTPRLATRPQSEHLRSWCTPLLNFVQSPSENDSPALFSGVIALQKSVANGLLFATIFATKGAP